MSGSAIAGRWNTLGLGKEHPEMISVSGAALRGVWSHGVGAPLARVQAIEAPRCECVPLGASASTELRTWAKTGWQYFRPRVEGGYLRFFWNPSSRLWRVQDKSGVIMEFGVVQGETDAVERDPNNVLRVFRWNLKRQIDSNGNEVRYYYDIRDGNQVYLTDILYTAPTGATSSVSSDAWAYQVKLSFATRADQATSCRCGWETIQRYRPRDGVASCQCTGYTRWDA